MYRREKRERVASLDVTGVLARLAQLLPVTVEQERKRHEDCRKAAEQDAPVQNREIAGSAEIVEESWGKDCRDSNVFSGQLSRQTQSCGPKGTRDVRGNAPPIMLLLCVDAHVSNQAQELGLPGGDDTYLKKSLPARTDACLLA